MLRLPSTTWRWWPGMALLAGFFMACAEPTPVSGRVAEADAGSEFDDETEEEEEVSACNQDGMCDSGETCSSCAADCGLCEICKSDEVCEMDGACATCPDICGACETGCEEPTTPAEDPNPAHPVEGHNAGLPCLSCHTPDFDIAPPFVLAGTLYVDDEGNSPRPGATVIVTDAGGSEWKIVTTGNGNFWSSDTSIVFPITIRASACPSDVEMPQDAAAGQPASIAGNCNSCHSGTVDEEQGTVGRISLPL